MPVWVVAFTCCLQRLLLWFKVFSPVLRRGLFASRFFALTAYSSLHSSHCRGRCLPAGRLLTPVSPPAEFFGWFLGFVYRLLSTIMVCSRFVFIAHRFAYLFFLEAYHRFLMRRWLLRSCRPNSNRCHSVTCFCCSVPWGLDVVSQWPCDVCARSSRSFVASGSLRQISGWCSFSSSILQFIVLYPWFLISFLLVVSSSV